jgi:phosphate transport system protein
VRNDFEHQIDGLVGAVASMGERTDRMLTAALEALSLADTGAADRVVAADREVDRAYAQVQHGVLAAVALHGPVGGDLRLLTALVHVSLHLERMGDYAANVARTVKSSWDFPADESLASQLTEMGELAGQVGRESLRAFVARDAGAARVAAALDDGVDQLNVGIFHRLVRLAAADEERLEWATWMIQLVRQLERYADHGVDIAEQTVFAVTGQLKELSNRRPGD